MRQKYFFLFLVTLVFFFVLPANAFATITFSIQTDKQSIGRNDELSITIAITGLTSCKTCYLQSAFTVSSSSPRYFGYTQNNASSWYKYDSGASSDTIQSSFFSFQPVDGNWNGAIKAKIDPADLDYKGGGQYYIKVFRYTGNSNSYAGYADNEPTITIVDSIPTPSPSISPKPSTSPSLSPKPSVSPSASKAPTAAAASHTTVPTSKITSSTNTQANFAQPANQLPSVELPKEVLGVSSDSADASEEANISPSSKTVFLSPTSTKLFEGMATDGKNTYAKLFMLAGFLILGFCGILLCYQYWKKKKLSQWS